MGGLRFLKTPFLWIARMVGIAAIAVRGMGTRGHGTSAQLLLATTAHAFGNQGTFILGDCSANL